MKTKLRIVESTLANRDTIVMVMLGERELCRYAFYSRESRSAAYENARSYIQGWRDSREAITLSDLDELRAAFP